MALTPPRSFSSPSTLINSDANLQHPHKLTFSNPNKLNSPIKQAPLVSNRGYRASICRCNNESLDFGESEWGWESGLKEAVRNAMKKVEMFVREWKREEGESGERVEGDEEWDWERWRKHFDEVDDQERVVAMLKSQLSRAISRENYEEAAKLKVAIAAATTTDTVSKVISHLNKAIKEERYEDAAFIRDYASAGLVGWWAGVSEDVNDPYGRIIRISAEHGRYVARSYSPRQLAAARGGTPLFELFLTTSKKGAYKEQAVYLKQKEAAPQDFPILSTKSLGPTVGLDPTDPTTDRTDLITEAVEDKDDGEDGDDDDYISEGSGFGNILQDMIPGVKIKVLKVTVPDKVDTDHISKVVEQIMEAEDDEDDTDLESSDAEDDKDEDDKDKNGLAVDSGGGLIDGEEQNQLAVKFVVGGLIQKMSGTGRKDVSRVPARLEKKGRLSFRFTVDEDKKELVSGVIGRSPQNTKTMLQSQKSMDHVMLDLAKSIGRGKIPMKVLKDVGKLLTLTLSQAQNRQPLSGSTTFNRIDLPASSDPFKGVYIGAHGLYSSEVIQIKRKFGQWQEGGDTKEHQTLEFYEYIEAVKLTGDPNVPAGQVAFRAKVGKEYQLPHKGIIPEEFGVVARYKGQGRLADPGFRNPRWVDGEVVIMDGKYIKSGPVIGFVYWAPKYHFLVFFNQLRLQK
ncbi:Protein EXECUTER 1, chloroplastic [Heracleum sosnowskyi]|uniref:Protein EXECUTER 1, chloroplastic n=1 Tax=Heracleum sosnowskyi TaxID=360622 RepID=A0AAD8H3R0_9APIA|nr:Protein EXECUTER 1, chloroplastic [Heracleum sosnowskyi]